MKRREFISLGIVASLGIYSFRVEPFWVEYVHQLMPVRNLPNNLVGKTLIQISDLHIGNRFDYNYQIASFKFISNLKPDFVVYTGDFVTYESSKQFEQLKQVFKNAPLGSLGTYAILGNHDYGKNWRQNEVADSVINTLNNFGLNFLRNESKNSSNLNFIGLDDYWGPNFKPEQTLANINSNDANLVLCHNPDALDLNIWNNYKGWILSGHTHGGQVKPPFLPPPLLPVRNKKYSSGKINLEDGRTLYINRALGNLWPVRFNMRPEITIFTLDRT